MPPDTLLANTSACQLSSTRDFREDLKFEFVRYAFHYPAWTPASLFRIGQLNMLCHTALKLLRLALARSPSCLMEIPPQMEIRPERHSQTPQWAGEGAYLAESNFFFFFARSVFCWFSFLSWLTPQSDKHRASNWVYRRGWDNRQDKTLG